jgi:D-proline reductase (dithiol) PrdB
MDMASKSAQNTATIPSPEALPETLEAFKNSFSYGSRNDLLFKFIKRLSSEQAGEFFRQLLERLGEACDDGNFDRVVQHAYTWQVRGYTPSPEEKRPWIYEQGPFTPLQKPLAHSRLVLLTSSGHFVDGDDPEPFGVKNMTQEEAVQRIGEFLKAAPQLSTIPLDTPRDRLRVRHGGYDIRGAQADHNVVLPLDRLRELAGAGVIGECAPQAYSFVGAASQTLIRKTSAPQWADMLKQQGMDVVLLVPV